MNTTVDVIEELADTTSTAAATVVADNTKLLIGVDYGGVCSSDSVQHEDEKQPVPNTTGELGINVPNCLDSLRKLASRHKLVLISFCGKKRAEATKKYFSTIDHSFSEFYYVKNRAFKADVCKKLGVDLMIDDRLDVLELIGTTLVPPSTATLHFGSHPSDIVCKFKPTYHVDNWIEVINLSETFTKTNLLPDATINLANKVY
jgi:hypothetical protein